MLFPDNLGDNKNLRTEQLVSLAQNGFSYATSLLLLRFSPTVRILAAKFCHKSFDVDDAVQEGMMGLLSAIYTFKDGAGSNFKTYASVCIRNRILTFLKINSRQNHLPFFNDKELEDIIDDGSNPEDLIIAQEDFLRLQMSLFSKLSQAEREVINLFLSGCSYEEIANRLGSTAKSVDNALQRVRRKLRETDLT